MNNLALLTLIDHVEINVGFWVSLLFPVVTRFYWPWNRSWWGWNTILLELSIAGVLFPGWLYLTFDWGSVYVLAWMELGFFALVILNVIWRAVMIWRTQRDGAARDAEEPPA